MTKTALITGITGQDGSYLAELLLDQGLRVCGIVRRSSTENFQRIEHLRGRLELFQADLLDQTSLAAVLREVGPDEVYNLAAMSFVPTSWQQPVLTAEFTALGVTRLLDAIRQVVPQGPLLPGLQQRDVRQGARDAAARDDAVPPALALRRGQGLRPFHHGELPRELRPVRLLAASCSTTSRRGAAWSSSRARSPTAWPASSSAWRTSCGWATWRPSATGASPAITCGPCG